MFEMLSFIETLSLDDRLYWEVGSTKGKLRFEIMWQKDSSPNPWRIRPKGSDQWTELNSSGLIKKLNQWDACTDQFERQVGASIMTQAVFADQVIQGATKLFGEDAVQQGIEDARQFLQAVANSIKEQTSPQAPKPSPLKLVTNPTPKSIH
jgi:hypothetical protein